MKMNSTKKTVYEVIREINSDILAYSGDNLLADGIADSFEIVDIVLALEDALHIEIDSEDVIADNFANLDTILSLVNRYMS